MTWVISETGQPDKAAIDRLGNKLLIGNGYLSYRGTLEEYGKEQKIATIVAGLYDQVGELWREPANVPNGLCLQVLYQGEPLQAQASRVSEHWQALDIQHGIHTRQTTFVTDDGNGITITSERFASLVELHLICLRYTVQAEQDCTLVLRTGIDGEVWDLNGPHLCGFDTSQAQDIISLTTTTHEKKIGIAVSEVLQHDLGSERLVQEDQYLGREVSIKANAFSTYTLTKFCAIHTGNDSPDPLAEGRQLLTAASLQGFDRLRQQHCRAWEARWQRCDIQISGDEVAQLALRFSLYHLLAIAPAHTSTASIPARGLSGQVYKGAIFWDTEIFMLPFFTHAFPAIARQLVRYRFQTLEGARRKAKEYGYRGAFYAWESQDSGDDACTLFNVTDVFTNRPMRTYFRDKQVHISADIVYALWQYYLVTGDDSIFIEGGAEIIFECARFYLSHLYYNPDKQRHEVLDVTGPDEYHERVHNNTFTNLMVAHTFEVCLHVIDVIRERDLTFMDALLTELGFQQDLQTIREVVKTLYIPQPEPTSGVIPQFDGYFSLQDIGLEDLLKQKLQPHEYLGGGNGLATTTQIIKQADVVLAMVVFSQKYSRAVKTTNWEYYEPRTEHGSSLSACSYSLIAAQIGKVSWAYRYFMQTASIDLTGESKQYVGPLYIGGTHPAANGGAWMSAVFGLCGIKSSGHTLTVDPHLPENWTEVVVPLTIQGEMISVTISQTQISVQAMQPLKRPIYVRVNGETHLMPEHRLQIKTLPGAAK